MLRLFPACSLAFAPVPGLDMLSGPVHWRGRATFQSLVPDRSAEVLLSGDAPKPKPGEPPHPPEPRPSTIPTPIDVPAPDPTDVPVPEPWDVPPPDPSDPRPKSIP